MYKERINHSYRYFFFQPKRIDSFWMPKKYGASNEYPICFRREIRKILCGYPCLSGGMINALMRQHRCAVRWSCCLCPTKPCCYGKWINCHFSNVDNFYWREFTSLVYKKEHFQYGGFSLRKEFAPKGSKFFPLKWAPNEKGGKLKYFFQGYFP